MEDMKFTLKKAVFDTSANGNLTLTNLNDMYKIFKNKMQLEHLMVLVLLEFLQKNHGMHSTTDNVTIAGLASGTYNGIAHSDINGTYTSISNITLDSYDINNFRNSECNR